MHDNAPYDLYQRPHARAFDLQLGFPLGEQPVVHMAAENSFLPTSSPTQ